MGEGAVRWLLLMMFNISVQTSCDSLTCRLYYVLLTTIIDLYVTYSFVSFMEDFEKTPLVNSSDGCYLPLLKILIDDGTCTHFNTLFCTSDKNYFRIGILLLQYL